MSLAIPASYQINSEEQLSLFEDGSGFVFRGDTLAFDLHFDLMDKGMAVVLNDDASWMSLHLNGKRLEGVLYSHISAPKKINWELSSIPHRAKPQAKTALQAIRFSDKRALEQFTKDATTPLWSELLIEAATCGHEAMVALCLKAGASLHVDIESFENDEEASCMALTKAIDCGYTRIVAQLLQAGAQIGQHTFDLDRDNFYHACFLYQVQPEAGEKIISLLLDKGVDFRGMSAYYLSALMYTFPHGPQREAREDTRMLLSLIDAGVPLNDFMLINATEKDTPVMFAAHMGLFAPLKVLVEAGADIYAAYEGRNALDRLLYPLIIDPLMPHQQSEEIGLYLKAMGLVSTQGEDEVIEEEEEGTLKEDTISSLEALFLNKDH